MTVSLKRAKRANEHLEKQEPWRCRRPISLTCTHHGDRIEVPCGGWRECRGCAHRLQWKLRSRFLAGIEQVPAGQHPMFFTLTFPVQRAPDEDQAQAAWRSLVRRLRYRELLGEYGFILQRTRQDVLHWHGIGHFRYMADGLSLWRSLLVASGFGVQNRLVIAEPSHAGYITRYISSGLAELSNNRRAYGFSRRFPRSEAERGKRELATALDEIGARTECTWELTAQL